PLLLDGIGGFRSDWSKAVPQKVHAIITVPKCTPVGASRAPVAIVLHGLLGFHRNVLTLAEPFAKACWAVVGIDLPLHGSRSICFSDGDCASGTCDTNGKCTGAGGLKTWDDGD